MSNTVNILWLLIICIAFAGICGMAVIQLEKKAMEPQKVVEYALSECSFYSSPEHGRRTACGEIYDSLGITCATILDSLKCGDMVEMIRNDKRIICRVTDRMPRIYKTTHPDRLFDVSWAVACSLGITRQMGVGIVQWRKHTAIYQEAVR